MAANKLSNGLVVLSSAAILAVYAAGYQRTSAAADRFASHGNGDRRPETPISSRFVAPAEALPRPIAGDPAPVASDVLRPESQRQPELGQAQKRLDSPLTTDSSPSAVVPSEVAAMPAAPALAVPTAAVPVVNEPAPIPAAPVTPAPAQAAQSLYKDGTYTGWGSCRHGDIEAAVVIEGGRILSANISQCFTRYPCSWISNAPGQVVSRQSIEVDYVSGATQSIDAFRGAVAEALAKAR